MGLTEPLQKHRQSVLPFLERQGRTQRYVESLNALATALPSRRQTNKTGSPPSTVGQVATSLTVRTADPRYQQAQPQETLRSTPKATSTNAWSYSPAGRSHPRTRTSGSSTGTKLGTAPYLERSRQRPTGIARHTARNRRLQDALPAPPMVVLEERRKILINAYNRIISAINPVRTPTDRQKTNKGPDRPNSDHPRWEQFGNKICLGHPGQHTPPSELRYKSRA